MTFTRFSCRFSLLPVNIVSTKVQFLEKHKRKQSFLLTEGSVSQTFDTTQRVTTQICIDRIHEVVLSLPLNCCLSTHTMRRHRKAVINCSILMRLQ